MLENVIEIENHGPLIVSSNYWDFPAAKAGKVYVSVNAGAFRLLVPGAVAAAIEDMKTARECVVSRGPWPAQRLPDAFEILFDDGTAEPFALHLSPDAIDRLPIDADAAGEWVLSVWTRPRRGTPHKVMERPCWYRRVPRLPWLRSREAR